MEVGDDVDKINDGDELEIDAVTGVIRDLTNGVQITCPPLPKSMTSFLGGEMQTYFIPGKEQLGKPAGRKKTSPVLPGTFLGCQKKEIVQNQSRGRRYRAACGAATWTGP